MANTFMALASSVVSGSSTSVVTFSSIPSTYTDLVVIGVARSASSGLLQDNMILRINGNTGANYTIGRVNVLDGTTILASRSTTSTSIPITPISAATQTASIFSNFEIYFGKYTDTSRPKTVAWWGNGPSNTTTSTISGFGSGQYGQANSDFTAISSISFTISGSTFVAGSAFYLYGIS